MHYIVPKAANWIINIGILGLIVANYATNRLALYGEEKTIAGVLVVAMAIIVFYGVLKLRQMQTIYDAHCPPKAPK